MSNLRLPPHHFITSQEALRLPAGTQVLCLKDFGLPALPIIGDVGKVCAMPLSYRLKINVNLWFEGFPRPYHFTSKWFDTKELALLNDDIDEWKDEFILLGPEDV